ncbi:uncharacterized protein LOC127851919 [Dreissena polymorpha]|uniref:WH1 domain-containing protein n=1 Tax=Dreissena polymorpha TaxID=45954 RepID=A0A9D4I0E7_DREPO|nr:uncharacterized protein LOC127851919 [Dreissena polymorpha]XP_052241869.1 uncharacterized protein LOC127851919 [Dreissena polymorpha]XP_052241870.1 uncharacterized protein LOC127851919 [Dreissena polymorpha]XP_052241871.1 uncharacterized protein LOC127851919 [Dreissena polymorpha]KAH3739629.1 hypothetical protein DPMN_046283 [Dreissena polymorpha]
MLKHRVSIAGMQGQPTGVRPPPQQHTGAQTHMATAPFVNPNPYTCSVPKSMNQIPVQMNSDKSMAYPGPTAQNINQYPGGYHPASSRDAYENPYNMAEESANYNPPQKHADQFNDRTLFQQYHMQGSAPSSHPMSIGQQGAHYTETRTNQSVGISNQVPLIVTSESTARDGSRITNEKYDYTDNIPTTPLRSPELSSSSDTGNLSLNEIIMSEKYREGVTEQDLLQVDTFYRSHKSDVFVCGCLANMYIGSVKNPEQWVFNATGIPLLLLDSGEHHRQRKLYIVLAEKGTGFTIWREVIDNLTSFKTPNANFHTMHLSKDHTKLAGLSYDDANKAKEFYCHLEKLTSDPDDDLLKLGNIKKKSKSMRDKKKKIKLPKKTEISQPCCFVHVTKLDRPMSESDLSNAGKGSPKVNEISAPFNFKHVTGTATDSNSLSGSLPNMLGSKLTLASSSSVDSGLSSEDRNSSKNSK